MSDVLILLAEIADENPRVIYSDISAGLALLVEHGYVTAECGKWIPTQAGVDLLAEYNWVG